MTAQIVFKPQSYSLSGLHGISDQTLDLHLGPYEGYVKATNTLNEKISALLENDGVDHENTPAYSELKRRLEFEYNGMVLHEYYFGNLGRAVAEAPKAGSEFWQRVQTGFESFARWRSDFTSAGAMRGIGWAICYADPASGRLSNHWIASHEVGHVAGYRPLLVMDLRERAFLLDYKPAAKEKYIAAFFFQRRLALRRKTSGAGLAPGRRPGSDRGSDPPAGGCASHAPREQHDSY